MSEYLYWSGVFLNVVGGIGFAAFLGSWAIDKVLKLTGVVVPFTLWYIERATQRKSRVKG